MKMMKSFKMWCLISAPNNNSLPLLVGRFTLILNNIKQDMRQTKNYINYFWTEK